METWLFAIFWAGIGIRGAVVCAYQNPGLGIIETLLLWVALIVFTPPLTT